MLKNPDYTSSVSDFYKQKSREDYMKGGIYTRENCPICGNRMADNHRTGCSCPDHPEQRARKLIVKFPSGSSKYPDIFINFSAGQYENAVDCLQSMRLKRRENSFDPRDYLSKSPLAFSAISERWLEHKRRPRQNRQGRSRVISKSTLQSYENYVRKAQDYFKAQAAEFKKTDINIKLISEADIEDMLYSFTGISDKTRANHLDCYKQLWTWASKREKFPLIDFSSIRVEYELGWRPYVDFEAQDAILEEIRTMTLTNPKVWLGCEMASRYAKLRPGDLNRITEGDINAKTGEIVIRYPTKVKNRAKSITLNPRHLEIVREFKDRWPALPHIPFFRHAPGNRNATPDAPFFPNLFYKYFVRAGVKLGYISKGNVWTCRDCGHRFETEGKKPEPCPKCAAADPIKEKQLDLYGGTRHTTTIETAKALGKEAAKAALGNTTNKSTERYLEGHGDESDRIALEMERLRAGRVLKIEKG